MIPPRLRQAFETQARACAAIGSPFMARLMGLAAARLSPDLDLVARMAAWDGDVGPHGASLPLRLAGGLHALVLSGTAPSLAAVYPPHAVSDDDLWQAVAETLETRAAEVNRWLNSPPQTNEVRRSAALIPVAHALSARFGQPLVLSELGASGGLNLNFDRFALMANSTRLGPADAAVTLRPDWRGADPVAGPLRIAERRGVDLNPIDGQTAEGRLRLLAYLWPDQQARLDRTRAALALPPAPVDRADALDWLPNRLATVPPNHVHLVYSTIAWQYLPPAAQTAGAAMIAAAGAAGPGALAWLRMEGDGADPGAALTLQLWAPSQNAMQTSGPDLLGRVDYHGRWIDWAPGGAI